MKVAVLSDVHGNLPALNVVLDHIDRWQPDHVIVNGDVVNRGPLPVVCWDKLWGMAQQKPSWQMTIGNHEQFVLEWLNEQRVLTEAEAQSYQGSRWTFDKLNQDQLNAIQQLPICATVTAPDGSLLYATHASRLGTTQGIVPWTTDDDLRKKVLPASGEQKPAVFVTSHTHRVFQKQIDGVQVVNSGSVGIPLDGMTATGYAQFTWHNGVWKSDLIRLPYDRDATKRLFAETNFIDGCGPIGRLMYREWRDARSHIGPFALAYGSAITNNEIKVSEAVAAYLTDLESFPS